MGKAHILYILHCIVHSITLSESVSYEDMSDHCNYTNYAFTHK